MKKDMEKDAILEKVRKQVERFLNDTLDARSTSEKCRDYYDHKQWSYQEEAILRARGQAPVVVNRVRPKVEGLKGLVSLRQSDPKVFPRTKKHDRSAEVITDALRYVADNVDFPSTKLDVAEEFFIEGYGGTVIDVVQKKDDIEIRISKIPWDRIYFDTHSRRKDFKDARYLGYIIWMDREEVEEMFPDVDFDAVTVGGFDNTFNDRPYYSSSCWAKDSRVRIAWHFYKHKGAWYMCAFTGETFLVDPQVSPYLDEDGEPTCPIELQCANIDRENQRYGEVLGFLSQQDEINHRRSKALHLLNQRQTMARNGAIEDVDLMKRELSHPRGHVEYNGERGDFDILRTDDMVQGQLALYEDAKRELDAVSVNAQLSGERQQGSLSGVAINRLQQAGTMELNSLFEGLRSWEKRVYRQVWARIRQFWTEEKWIRVTDDQDSLRWVGLNTPMTAQEALEEKVNDESLPLQERKQAAALYQMMMQNQDPRLQQIVEVKNNVAELDVDIILDQSFDTINVQEEQFEMLAKFAQGSDIDIIDLIELSQLRGKKELIEKIEKRRQAAAQASGDMARIKSESEQAKTQETMQKASKLEQEALTQKIQNMTTIGQVAAMAMTGQPALAAPEQQPQPSGQF